MKKALNIIRIVLVWTLVAISVFMMVFTIVSVATFNKTDRSLFGFKFFIVQTDSMSRPEDGGREGMTYFDAKDIVIVKNVDMDQRSSLEPDTVITFISRNKDSFGETITHAIRRKGRDNEGAPGFITYGANTETDDEAVVGYGDIVGRYVGRIPKLGAFFAFLKTTPGYIVCIFVPIVLLILYNGTNVIRLFRKYKKEQTAEMDEERKKLEEERKQSEEMLAQLQALKAEIERHKAEAGTLSDPAPPAQTDNPPAQTDNPPAQTDVPPAGPDQDPGASA